MTAHIQNQNYSAYPSNTIDISLIKCSKKLGEAIITSDAKISTYTGNIKKPNKEKKKARERHLQRAHNNSVATDTIKNSF